MAPRHAVSRSSIASKSPIASRSESLTNRIAAIASRIERVNSALGRTVAWCALAMVLVQMVVVAMRYVLGLGSIWLTETILYAHATLFLMGAAWTLQVGGHVRSTSFMPARGCAPRPGSTSPAP
jgi:hypothetical protein